MEKDTKLVLGIAGGGFLVLIILFVTILSLLGNSDGLNGTSFGNTVAVIPLQGEIAYGQSSFLEISVITPQTALIVLKKQKRTVQ